jgi:hypothetical protein
MMFIGAKPIRRAGSLFRARWNEHRWSAVCASTVTELCKKLPDVRDNWYAVRLDGDRVELRHATYGTVEALCAWSPNVSLLARQAPTALALALSVHAESKPM